MNRIEQRLGAQPDMIGLVSTLVVTGILLIVGLVVFAKVKAALPDTDLSAAANNTIDEVESATYDAFSLTTVGLIVMAAAVIIAVLLGAFGA